MDANMQPVADALAELTESELRALAVTANELVLEAAGLLVWMEHLADWELKRRAGSFFPLQSPDAAIPPAERADSVVALTTLRDGFAEGSWADSVPVLALFDAIAGVLAGTAVAR
jgi:hypothetical protein